MDNTAKIEGALEAAAHAAHEANRAYCIALGDLSQAAWTFAPDWQRRSAIEGVKGVLEGNGPEASHASWLAMKEREGWAYGLVKDVERKLHPCFVPYADLPPAQKAKDGIFVSVAQAVLGALGHYPPNAPNAERVG